MDWNRREYISLNWNPRHFAPQSAEGTYRKQQADADIAQVKH